MFAHRHILRAVSREEREDNPLLPFGTIYLSGKRTRALDVVARRNLENANEAYEQMPLGILVQPLTRSYLRDVAENYQWVDVDNGCFTEVGQARFSIDRYLGLIDEALDTFGEDYVLFATAEDVAFDWKGTRRKSLPTLPRIRAAGAPAALVVQDGATPGNIPWSECDAIFVGGSTEWKLSPVAAAIVREANRHHKWTHMGRVNSAQRLMIAHRFGCGSVDGTYLLHEDRKGQGAQAIENMLDWIRQGWKASVQRRMAR